MFLGLSKLIKFIIGGNKILTAEETGLWQARKGEQIILAQFLGIQFTV